MIHSYEGKEKIKPGIVTHESRGGEAAAALNESLIFGLLTTGAGRLIELLVGDIGLLTAARRRCSASYAEIGGLVASGEGLDGVDPAKDVLLRKAGTGGGGIKPAPAADEDPARPPPGVVAVASAGGEAPAGVGMAAELPPPGGLNSA